MSFPGLIFLFSILYLDLWVFKKRNRAIFFEAFFFPPVILNILAGLTLIFLLGSVDAFDPILFLAIFGILPIYIIRRFKFNQIMNSYESDFQEDVWEKDPHGKLHLLSDALGIVIAWILTSLGMELILDGFIDQELKSAEFIKVLISSGLSSVLLFWLILKSFSRQEQGGFRQNLGLIQEHKSWIRIYLIPTIAGLIFAGLSSWLVEMRPIQPDTPLSELMATVDSSWLVMFFLFLAILIAPFVEELVFRGYFYYVLNTIFGKMPAFFAVALVFAFLHVGQYWGDWLAIGMVTLLGFLLTFLRVWTGSTWASITGHYVYNTAVTFIPVMILIFSNPAYFKYQVYYDQLDAPAKETLLLTSIEKNHELADAYNDLAWLYGEEYKNLDQALELVDTALSLSPNNSAYLDTKSFVLERMGKHEEALEIKKLAEGKN